MCTKLRRGSLPGHLGDLYLLGDLKDPEKKANVCHRKLMMTENVTQPHAAEGLMFKHVKRQKTCSYKITPLPIALQWKAG